MVVIDSDDSQEKQQQQQALFDQMAKENHEILTKEFALKQQQLHEIDAKINQKSGELNSKMAQMSEKEQKLNHLLQKIEEQKAINLQNENNRVAELQAKIAALEAKRKQDAENERLQAIQKQIQELEAKTNQPPKQDDSRLNTLQRQIDELEFRNKQQTKEIEILNAKKLDQNANLPASQSDELIKVFANDFMTLQKEIYHSNKARMDQFEQQLQKTQELIVAANEREPIYVKNNSESESAPAPAPAPQPPIQYPNYYYPPQPMPYQMPIYPTQQMQMDPTGTAAIYPQQQIAKKPSGFLTFIIVLGIILLLGVIAYALLAYFGYTPWF